jgi:hypothetical protein
MTELWGVSRPSGSMETRFDAGAAIEPGMVGWASARNGVTRTAAARWSARKVHLPERVYSSRDSVAARALPTERGCMISKGRQGPLCAVDLFDLMRRHEARNFAPIHHHETTAPGAKQFVVHKVLNVRRAVYRGTVSRHNVRSPNAFECVCQSGLMVALPRCLRRNQPTKAIGSVDRAFYDPPWFEPRSVVRLIRPSKPCLPYYPVGPKDKIRRTLWFSLRSPGLPVQSKPGEPVIVRLRPVAGIALSSGRIRYVIGVFSLRARDGAQHGSVNHV